jgi:hypothetical protein
MATKNKTMLKRKSSTKKTSGKKKNNPESKYVLYEKSVQNVEADIEFINEKCQELGKKKPYTLREDFGGTAKLACEWVKQSSKHFSFAIDLDPEPIKFGLANHKTKLALDAQARVNYLRQDVLDSENVRTDIIVAFNFSYFIFKKRKQLMEYFKSVRRSLNKDGVFFIDLFGGEEGQTVQEEKTKYKNFTYFWDLKKFNPITNECFFSIHFKPKDGKKMMNCFTYDWRLWSLPELRDILEDAGFSKTVAFWEQDDQDGEYVISETAENCPGWVTYLAAIP